MWITVIQAFSVIFCVFAFEPKRIEFESKNKLTIGGLFPIHHKGPNETEPCGAIMPEKGIQRLEAMLYALDQINKNSREWNFNLGAIILDTCSSDSFTLEQSLLFLQNNCGDVSSKRKVAGIVGASNSAVSEAVANIFRLFKIPQVSYASTSEELDNLHKYPYFFRVVPSDKFQVRAILDILIHFKWTYISAVISRGDYGELALKTLQELVDNVTMSEICFAEVHTLPRNPSEDDYNNAIYSLKKHQLVKVVIVFLNEDKVKHLLAAAQRCDVAPGRFVWLGSDGWGAKMHPVRGNEGIAEGAITLLPKRFHVEGFDEYFLSLKPKTNTRNVWFEEFWEHQFNCTFSSNRSISQTCTGEEDLKDAYRQEGLVPMVIDSVFLIATAIKSACKEKPQYCKSSSDKDTNFRKLLKEHVAKVHLKSSQGHNMVVKFDSEKNIPTYYKIYQFKRTNFGKYEYKEIGEWSQNNKSRLKIADDPTWGDSDGISSVCSRECNRGEERIVKNPNKRCCWECRLCGDEEYVSDELSHAHCTPCPVGFISNSERTACKELELDYIGRNLKSPWALVPFSFAIFGLFSTVIVLIVFFLYHKTPIIKAAGRELCYVILAGVALCYCFTFIVLMKPSELSCGILRTGMGLGLSICYAAIFTKTNRISRIFNRSLRIMKRPSYISPESQLVICSCLILIEVILTVMWLIVTPPTVKQIMLMNPRAYVSLCGFDGTSVILALLYNMVLIILCTYYAYKTRNIPENFNESKYISFTMYASCIVWLAFIPIYFSAWQDYKVQSAVLCMSVSISGSVTLACLFLPKIYIVLFHPEKNVRYPNSSPTSSTPSINITPVRFLRSNQNSPASPHRIPKKSKEVNSNTENHFLMVRQPSDNQKPEDC